MANVANLRINAVVNDQASGALKRINGALNGLNTGMTGTSGGALGAARALTSVGSSGSMAAVGIGVAVAATAALVMGTIAVVKASVAAASEVEGYRNTLIRLTGDAGKADAMLSKLQGFADWSPFDDATVMQSAQRLLGAGVAAEDVTKVMTALSDVSGDSSETFMRASVAFSQMALKGKVSQEELNQFAEAGIPAQKMLADAMGVSTSALGEMVQKGLVPANKALPLLVNEIGNKFAGATERASQSVKGLQSTLDAKLTRSFASLGMAIEPLTKDVLRGLTSLLEDLDNGIKAITSTQEFQDFLAAAGEAFKAILEVARPVMTILFDLARAVLPLISAGLQVFSLGMRILGGALQFVVRLLKPIFDGFRFIAQAIKYVIGYAIAFVVGLGQMIKVIALTIKSFADWVLSLPGVQEAITLVSDTVSALYQYLSDLTASAWSLVLSGWDAAKTTANELGEALKPLVDRAIEIAVEVANDAFSLLQQVAQELAPIKDRFVNIVVSGAQDALATLKPLGESIGRITDKTVDFVINLIGSAPSDIKRVYDEIVKGLGAFYDLMVRIYAPQIKFVLDIERWLEDNIAPLVIYTLKLLMPGSGTAITFGEWVADNLYDLLMLPLRLLFPGMDLLLALKRFVDANIAPMFDIEVRLRIEAAIIEGLKTAVLLALGPLGLIIMAGKALKATDPVGGAFPPTPAAESAPGAAASNPSYTSDILSGLVPGISAGSGTPDLGHGCFTADTRVWTANGLRRISEIVIGAMVEVYDPETREVVMAPVGQTFVHLDHALWHLRIYGDVVTTTAEHPFLTADGWLRADELRSGMAVVTPSGVEVVEESHARGDTATVYNLHVDHPAHTYLIGSARWVVHNKMALARGGIVTAPTFALIGESGAEAVIPLDKAFGGSGALGGLGGANIDTVIINVSGFADGATAGRAAADAFRRQLGLQRRLPFGTA